MKKKVLVLLSSYNGEKFILEQINSILNQTNVTIKLIIRDDGSTDNTATIIKKLKSPRVTLIQGDNIGCIRSFTQLVISAKKEYENFDYIAFADQDDIWEAEKLYAASQLLATLDDTTPNLYFCNMNLVDKDNKHKCFLRSCNLNITKENSLFGGVAAGCTMVFNKTAVDYYCIKPIESDVYHDYWLFLICVFWGKVLYDTNAYIHYRQHENNVLGLHNRMSYFKRSVDRLKFWFFHTDKIDIQRNRIQKFYNEFKGEFSDVDKNIIELYLLHSCNFLGRIKLLLRKGYYPPEKGIIKIKMIPLFIIKVILGKI